MRVFEWFSAVLVLNWPSDDVFDDWICAMKVALGASKQLKSARRNTTNDLANMHRGNLGLQTALAFTAGNPISESNMKLIASYRL